MRRCVIKYWYSLCSHIEFARDSRNIKEMFSSIKTATSLIIRELLYADDAALRVSAPDKLQNFLNCFSGACDLYGLLI